MNIYQSSAMSKKSLSPETAAILSLQALAWLLGQEQLVDRFISLTGLTPETLRSRADHADMQTAVLDFLLSHEPDLCACAAALDMRPSDFVAARQILAPEMS